MRRITLIILLSAATFSCSKSENDDNNIDNAWLEKQKAALSSCVCLTGIFQGNYQGNTIYIIRSIDPSCCGVDVVYKSDGTRLFISGDQLEYQNFLNSVTNLQMIWSCSKGQK